MIKNIFKVVKFVPRIMWIISGALYASTIALEKSSQKFWDEFKISFKKESVRVLMTPSKIKLEDE